MMMKSDCIVTVFGTIGLEATLFKKRVLLADKSHYSDWGIGTVSKSRNEYFNYLRNIETLKTPTNAQVDKASSFIYFSMAPHPKVSNLIKFDDDVDQKHIHKQIQKFKFKINSKEYKESLSIAEWFNSDIKSYSSFIKTKYIKNKRVKI